ncbi:MAG: SsrA-binding protein SmpB [Elusimicrobia bacterium]|nr:SsrA-binding protein SmpB [Elusimicrobiota bacterium]
MAKTKPEGRKLIASNRKASFHYEILEEYEAGLSLKGPEVKSLRGGQASLEGSFARVEGAELQLYNLYIPPYRHNTVEEIEPRRTRKLLLNRREINRLMGRMQGQSLALVPMELYFKRGWAKVRLALARGRRGPDKREKLRREDASREMERSFKNKFKA